MSAAPATWRTRPRAWLGIVAALLVIIGIGDLAWVPGYSSFCFTTDKCAVATELLRSAPRFRLWLRTALDCALVASYVAWFVVTFRTRLSRGAPRRAWHWLMLGIGCAAALVDMAENMAIAGESATRTVAVMTLLKFALFAAPAAAALVLTIFPRRDAT